MDDGWDARLGLPTSNRDQSCAFCGADQPSFAHRLDDRSVAYRFDDDGYTLPTFWATCAECERSVVAGDDAALLAQLVSQDVEADEGFGAATLVAFRASDLGATPLASG